MDAKNNIYAQFGILGMLFRFVDSHKIIVNILLVLQILAIFWAAVNYNFTTSGF